MYSKYHKYASIIVTWELYYVIFTNLVVVNSPQKSEKPLRFWFRVLDLRVGNLRDRPAMYHGLYGTLVLLTKGDTIFSNYIRLLNIFTYCELEDITCYFMLLHVITVNY
jgi:hypothetical protein